MPHAYRIIAEKLSQPGGEAPISTAFEVTNHDDIVPLIDRVRTLNIVPETEVAAFTVGLKLFIDVLMRHRREPLFEPLHPHILEFMKRLKANAPAQAA